MNCILTLFVEINIADIDFTKLIGLDSKLFDNSFLLLMSSDKHGYYNLQYFNMTSNTLISRWGEAQSAQWFYPDDVPSPELARAIAKSQVHNLLPAIVAPKRLPKAAGDTCHGRCKIQEF